MESTSVGVLGSARGLPAGAAAGRPLDCENPPHVA